MSTLVIKTSITNLLKCQENMPVKTSIRRLALIGLTEIDNDEWYNDFHMDSDEISLAYGLSDQEKDVLRHTIQNTNDPINSTFLKMGKCGFLAELNTKNERGYRLNWCYADSVQELIDNMIQIDKDVSEE